MTIIENLEGMLARGQDTALLRFSLGNEYFKARRFEDAVLHLRAAVAHDAAYSAAWKMLGKAFAEGGHDARAEDAYEQGIAAAEAAGDRQAAKEMRVFLKRLRKPQGDGQAT